MRPVLLLIIKKMARTRRTLRQIHPNLSRQFQNQFEFLTAVNNFNAENLRRRNPPPNYRNRSVPYVVRRQGPSAAIPDQFIEDILHPAVRF